MWYVEGGGRGESGLWMGGQNLVWGHLMNRGEDKLQMMKVRGCLCLIFPLVERKLC